LYRHHGYVRALRTDAEPACFVIELAELPNRRASIHDEEARHLLVAAVRRSHRGFDNQVNVLHGDRVRLEAADGSLREDRFAERHREPAMVHGVLSPLY